MSIKIISEKKVQKITISNKFNSRLQEGDTRYVPEPLQYDKTNANKYKNKNPSYRIGKAKKRGLYNSIDNPGPGQYHITSSFDDINN